MSYSRLPKLLGEIAEVAGLDAALALAKKRGGTEIYVPPAPGDDHWLVQALGREAAEAICTIYGSTRQKVPLGPTGSIAEIRRTVDRMIAEGKSTREIALAAGYTERTIHRRRAKLRNQGELF